MSLGIIGVGHLAAFSVEGFRRGGYRAPILLSPRSAAKAAALAEAFDCRVLSDNAQVAAEAESLLLAVRPGDLETALEDLPLRPGQLLISTLDPNQKLDHSPIWDQSGKFCDQESQYSSTFSSAPTSIMQVT